LRVTVTDRYRLTGASSIASALPAVSIQNVFRNTPEDNVCSLLVAWYAEHLCRGGDHDPTMDNLIAEMIAEDAAGGYSYCSRTA
jgi:hypothetical protein